MDSVTVWVDDWQQQCCGASIAVGTETTWRVRSNDDAAWFATLLGPDTKQPVYIEDHHVGPSDTSLTGVVSKILVVTSRHELGRTSDGMSVMMPISSSTRYTPTTVADRRHEPTGVDAGWSLVGWIVTLEGATSEPLTDSPEDFQLPSPLPPKPRARRGSTR